MLYKRVTFLFYISLFIFNRAIAGSAIPQGGGPYYKSDIETISMHTAQITTHAANLQGAGRRLGAGWAPVGRRLGAGWAPVGCRSGAGRAPVIGCLYKREISTVMASSSSFLGLDIQQARTWSHFMLRRNWKMSDILQLSSS